MSWVKATSSVICKAIWPWYRIPYLTIKSVIYEGNKLSEIHNLQEQIGISCYDEFNPIEAKCNDIWSDDRNHNKFDGLNATPQSFKVLESSRDEDECHKKLWGLPG